LRASFSTSTITRNGHYETLAVPRNASKAQIKASFYKLSRQLHPDINPDVPKDKFVALNDAYSVLSDDRKRRAYDRKYAAQEVGGADVNSTHSHWHQTARRPRATWAWEHPRARTTPNSHAKYAHGTRDRTSPFVDRSKVLHHYSRYSPASETQHDPNVLHRQRHDSGFWRVIQVLSIAVLVFTIGSGLRVKS